MYCARPENVLVSKVVDLIANKLDTARCWLWEIEFEIIIVSVLVFGSVFEPGKMSSDLTGPELSIDWSIFLIKLGLGMILE